MREEGNRESGRWGNEEGGGASASGVSESAGVCVGRGSCMGIFEVRAVMKIRPMLRLAGARVALFASTKREGVLRVRAAVALRVGLQSTYAPTPATFAAKRVERLRTFSCEKRASVLDVNRRREYGGQVDATLASAAALGGGLATGLGDRNGGELLGDGGVDACPRQDRSDLR